VPCPFLIINTRSYIIIAHFLRVLSTESSIQPLNGASKHILLAEVDPLQTSSLTQIQIKLVGQKLALWHLLTCLAALRRSPIGYNGFRNKPLPSFSRFRPVKANLDKVHEESLDHGVDKRLRDEAYREFYTNEFVEVQQDDETEDEDDMADWDEETTIVAMLQNEWVYARIHQNKPSSEHSL
jgi:hypothetical protein